MVMKLIFTIRIHLKCITTLISILLVFLLIIMHTRTLQFLGQANLFVVITTGDGFIFRAVLNRERLAEIVRVGW